jgi:hypothetical protein
MAILGICIVPLALLGLIFGKIAERQVLESGQQGYGTARAAVIISVIIIGLWAVAIIVVISA